MRARGPSMAFLNPLVLQAVVGRELRLKRTPQLAFAYDPSVAHGVRMSHLIDELAPEPDDDGR